jgi:hypothetical protein
MSGIPFVAGFTSVGTATRGPNVAMYWLILLIRIREVLGPILGQEVGCPNQYLLRLPYFLPSSSLTTILPSDAVRPKQLKKVIN